MTEKFAFQLIQKPAGPNRLRAVSTAVALACDVEVTLRSVRRHRNLLDQVKRAAESIALNLAEGAGRSGKDKSYHYKIAYASAGETQAGLEILLAYDAINQAAFNRLASQIDSIRAITWRLIQR